MTRPLARLAWAAALATYLLIVLGGIVRITGSGLGCGDEWPVCHGRLIPSFADVPTLIEWSHRLVAAIVATLVVVLVGLVWWRRKRGVGSGEWSRPGRASFVALGLLIVQILLGAITVRLHLPPWTIVLHLGTAMLLFATLIATGMQLTPGASPGSTGDPHHLTPGASPGFPEGGLLSTPGFPEGGLFSTPGLRPQEVLSGRPGLAGAPAAGAAVMVFVTVLAGALTANLGAATACVGFPLCNGQWVVTGNYLQYVQWAHRLLAYTTFAYLLAWALATRRRAALLVLGVATLQTAIAAAMVTRAVPQILAAAHVAVGAALWGTVVSVALGPNLSRSSL